MPSGWILHNPAAGRLPAGMFLGKAREALERNGWSIQTAASSDASELKLLAERAVADGSHAVFVAGGDGSVGLVASALVDSPTALAVLPSGTANVWAAELGLTNLAWAPWAALERAAERLALGEPRLVDVGQANGRVFLLWAGTGLDARVVAALEPRTRLMKLVPTALYLAEVLRSTAGWDGLELEVEAEGQRWQGRFIVAVASNIRRYAGGLLELAPDALVDDGLLDFWLIGGRTAGDVVVRIAQMLARAHVDAPGVVHFQSNRATFHCEQSLHLHVDGEPLEVGPHLEIEILPRRLWVLAPSAGEMRLFTQLDSLQAVDS
ncbi:MAG TPA: diacylglycerol kinase family protein [Anaerolineales bacterium]|nr:diacylglycerol kinase family protein [Anaerolineales bacterium]